MNRAELISVRDLPKAIDDAVKHAIERANVKPDAGDSIIRRFEIYGRYLKDLKQAEGFADAMAAALKKAGHTNMEPAVIMVGGTITAGVVENGSISVRNI